MVACVARPAMLVWVGLCINSRVARIEKLQLISIGVERKRKNMMASASVDRDSMTEDMEERG